AMAATSLRTRSEGHRAGMRREMSKAPLCSSLAALLIACRSGGASQDASGGAGGGGAGGTSGYFITADVDGVTMRAEANASASWFQGSVPGYLVLAASGNGWQWGLTLINMQGTPPCGTASVQLVYDDAS